MELLLYVPLVFISFTVFNIVAYYLVKEILWYCFSTKKKRNQIGNKVVLGRAGLPDLFIIHIIDGKFRQFME